MNISFATKILITKTETVNNILLSNFFNNPFEMANKNKNEQGIKLCNRKQMRTY